MRYASGKIAHTICDICGITFDYKRRKKMWDGSITCPKCWNKKEESLDPAKYIPKHGDAEALRDGRPAQFDDPAPPPDYVTLLEEQFENEDS